MKIRSRDTELAERVKASLHHRADSLAVQERDFEPDHHIPDVIRAAERTRPRVGPALAAAAVAAVLAVGAVIAIAIDTDDGSSVERATSPAPSNEAPGSSESDTPSAQAPSADEVIGQLPGFVPDGLSAAEVRWRDITEGQAARAQLFEAGEAKVLLMINSPVAAVQDIEGPLSVRGTSGTHAPSKERPDVSGTIVWTEGADIEARYQGMSAAEAVTFLDGLLWRAQDPLQGFGVPPESDFEMTGDAEGGEATYRQTEVRYADSLLSVAPGDGLQLTVRAGDGGAAVPSLEARYLGGVDAEGRSVSYDPDFGTVRMTWPDGRHVWVDANATTISEADLLAVAGSLAPATRSQFVGLRSGAEDRVTAEVDLTASGTLMGTEDAPEVEVEVREAGATRFVCIRVAGDEGQRCGSEEGFDGAVGSFVIDGRWYVVAAGEESFDPMLRSSVGAEPGVPVEGARRIDLDGLSVTVAMPPVEDERIWLESSTAAGSVFRPLD